MTPLRILFAACAFSAGIVALLRKESATAIWAFSAFFCQVEIFIDSRKK